MARWDEILTLPVQNPPALEFSASDIVWSRVEGWRETMDRLALIPFSRVNDFVRGESNNKECPTRFHVEARRRRPPEMAYKPKVDGVLEYILYWCSFGPDDHRKGGSVRPSRTFSTKRKTPAGRPNTKRGCVCHFIVKRLIAEPSVALIIYNQDKHIDKKGLPCHGPLDKKAVGTRAMFAPYISDDLRLQLMSLLYVGVPVETIMQKHTEMVEKQGGPSSRDDLLTHRYVRRLERKIRRSTYDLDSDDAVSIQLWVENHQNLIFFYEDFSDSDPFVLGIQSEWQLQQMIRFGNNSIMASDSRFGINKLKYPIYSLLVFDSNNKSIPVAWIITPNFASGDLHRWMGALYDRVHTKDPTWKLGGFIVDDPSADVLAIREVFQCPVLISLWRIRHAWHKNLMDKCLDTELRAEMSKRLGNALSSICRGGGDVDLFESFMEDFVDCSDFLDYFKAIWFPRIGLWATAMKALPLASSEASVAIEYYHHQLKLRLLNEKDSDVYQRADWLVDKLGTEVHSYFWLDEYSGKDNFARYWKDEWRSGLTSWQLALQIPDSDVIMDNQCTKIVCSRNRAEMHIVRNPTSEFALCDCSWSRMGNLCKHVIKAAKICRDMGLASPSTSLFEYNRTLMNILHCPPQDSLMRDHAVALAVCVQSQLDTEFNLEKSKTTSSVVVPTELHRLSPSGVSETDGVGSVNKDLVNGSNSALENGGDLRNEDFFNIEKGDIARETAIDDLMDIDSQSVETASTSMVYIKKQMVDGNAFASDGVGHEPENLLDEGLDLGSSMCDIIANVDGSQGGDLGDSCGNEATVAGEGSNQPSVDVVANSISSKVVTMDPESSHNLPSKPSPGVSNDVSEEACKSKISEISTTTKKASDLAEENSFETMTIDTVEINSGVSYDAKMKQLMSSKCHGSVHQEDNIDGNNVVTESGVGGNVENSGNQDQTTDTPSGNQSTCGDIVGRHGMETWISGVWDLDEKKVASNSNLEISEIGLKACSVLDSLYGETEDVVMKSADAAGKVNDGEVVLKRNETISDNNGKSLEEIISSV